MPSSPEPAGPPPLVDGELRLRPWRAGDGDAVAAGADDVLSRRLGLPPVPWPDGLLAARAATWAEDWERGDRAGWVIENASGVAGFVELHAFEAWHRAELSWALLPSARGARVASRSVRLVLDWAFGRGLQRAEAWVEPDNVASLRVAAACGLRREGVSRGRQVIAGRARDLVLLARLRADVDPAVDALPTIAASLPRSSSASGLLVRCTDGRVLLLRTSYKPGWEVPGGFVESGEDVVTAAARECREELGVDLPVGDLLVLDHCDAEDPRPEITAALLDGGVHPPNLLSSFTYPDGEILEGRWCTADEVGELAGPRVRLRVLAAMTAFAEGGLPGATLLLRGGRPAGAG